MNQRIARTLWAFIVAAAGVSIVETARVPARLYAAHPWLVVEVLGAALAYALVLLCPALLPPTIGALAARFAPGRVAFAVAASTLTLGGIAHLMVALGDRVELPWYAAALYVFFAWLVAWIVVPESHPRGRLSRRRARAVGRVVLLLLAGLGSGLNGAILASGYPGLHYAELVFICLAATVLTSSVRDVFTGKVRAGLALLVGASIVLTLLGGSGVPHLRRYTYLGSAPLAFAPLRTEPGPGGEALGAGREVLGVPALPHDFDLAELNVVLITWEATGYRHTSLGGAAADVTPRLAELAQRSRSYTRAYSPSSNTFQSMSAILALGLPSTVPLRTSDRRWRGRLMDDVVTAAEHFERLGAHTLWVAHDYRRMFSRDNGIVGLDRGFREQVLVEGSHDPVVDRRVAERALKHIGRVATTRFFAWIHLTSPHSPYLAHGPTLDNSPRELHAGEVRYADEQLGFLLDGLDALGLADRTIVIVTADHGEEFGEHRSSAHGFTLYEEVIHVPLVVFVPGEGSRTIDGVTSTAYVLPWLLSHPSSGVSAAVEAQIAAWTTPVLEAADGAVVSELLGADRTQIALIGAGQKLIFDAHSGLIERFDRRLDPGELRPLPAAPGALHPFLAARRRYTRARVR